MGRYKGVIWLVLGIVSKAHVIVDHKLSVVKKLNFQAWKRNMVRLLHYYKNLNGGSNGNHNL